MVDFPWIIRQEFIKIDNMPPKGFEPSITGLKDQRSYR